MIKHFLFLFSILFLFRISQIIPETIVFKNETIRHVKIKSINTNTVVILNENGKLETIKKNIISRVVKKDKTGYKTDPIVEDKYQRRESKLKSDFKKEKTNAVNAEREKYEQQLQEKLEKERMEIARIEKEKYDRKIEQEKAELIKNEKEKYNEQLKSELAKEQKEGEQNFEAIKQKKVEEGKINAGAKPSNENIATSNYFFSPSDKVVALAGPGATCETMSDKKQWFVLFGTFPINKLKSEEIFKEDGRYRVYLKPTALDIVASIFLGIMTSVTVKTVYTETCQIESIYVLNENEVNTLIGKKSEDPVLKTEEKKSNQPNDNKPLQTIKEEKK